MEEMDEAHELAAETLAGDLRDVMLTHVRAMETPWSKLSEAQQSDTIAAISEGCRDIVRKAVAAVAKRSFDYVPIKVADFSVKEGEIKGKYTAHVSEEAVVTLADHYGATGYLVLASAADFMGERSEAKADPDQPELPTGGEDGDEPEPDAADMPDIPPSLDRRNKGEAA